MNAIAIHFPRGAVPASRFHRSLWLAAAAALLAAGLAGRPALAQGEAGPPAGDVLARYQVRHVHAMTIEQELKQRVAALERQDAVLSAQSTQLQQRLGDSLKRRQASDDAIRRLEAEAAAKQQLVNDAHARMGQLQRNREAIEQRIRDNKDKEWTCYVPFAQIYCLAADLIGQRNALGEQWRQVVVHLQALERESAHANARLAELRRERQAVDAERGRVQVEVDASVQRLKVVHAELASSREAHQRHRTSLDSFSTELKLVETLPPSERAGVIERRMTRLDAQLASEMGQACTLFTGGGAPLPEPVRQACTLV